MPPKRRTRSETPTDQIARKSTGSSPNKGKKSVVISSPNNKAAGKNKTANKTKKPAGKGGAKKQTESSSSEDDDDDDEEEETSSSDNDDEVAPAKPPNSAAAAAKKSAKPAGKKAGGGGNQQEDMVVNVFLEPSCTPNFLPSAAFAEHLFDLRLNPITLTEKTMEAAMNESNISTTSNNNNKKQQQDKDSNKPLQFTEKAWHGTCRQAVNIPQLGGKKPVTFLFSVVKPTESVELP